LAERPEEAEAEPVYILSVSSQLLRVLEPLELVEPVRVSVVIPCLNEADNIVRCVTLAREVLDENELSGEIIVVDNGSEDGSAELAERAGATVVREPRRGYGRAYLSGFEVARGDYILMIDADLTYDFREIPRFVKELDDGAELVMGNRMQSIEPGAMPWLNRYVGNPMMSGTINLLFKTRVRDPQCGMRAFRRDALPRLDLHSWGFEFASEMVFRAARLRLDVRQFPITLHPRGGGAPKLSPMRDGWRNLRLMLLHNPTFVFVLPGLLTVLFGVAAMAAVLANLSLFGRPFYSHTLIAGSLFVVVGSQLLGFGLCGRAFAVFQLGDRDPWFERNSARVRLEHGLLLGGGMTLAGMVVGSLVVAQWVAGGLGSLSEERVLILAATLVIVGIQVFFTSFLLSMLGMRRRGR
jgi:glycosyltransferase involved in cell wall biosynthesis